MRRKRAKAAKKVKLAKIKAIQEQLKIAETGKVTDRLEPHADIDATIKDSIKKVNKSLMKKDDRFKDVIGKVSKIKRKAENMKTKQNQVKDKANKKKKKI